MIEKTQLEFLTAWSEEFAGAIAFVEGLEGVTHNDGYAAFVSAFGQEPTPQLIAALTARALELLRAAAEARLEHRVPLERIQEAVRRTQLRWPVDPA